MASYISQAVTDVANRTAGGSMDPLTLSLIGGSLLGGLFGGRSQPSSQELGQMTAEDFQRMLQIPQIRDLLQLQSAQALRLEPLQAAASQLAFQLLPVHARQGIDFWTVPTPQLSTFPGTTPSSGSAAYGTVTDTGGPPPIPEQAPRPGSNFGVPNLTRPLPPGAVRPPEERGY